MSIFDGVSAYQSEEGSQYDKITAGISATIGDFLGAPLDLIKNLGAWVLGKFGFDETADAIRDFNIEESITNLLNGIFDFPAKAIEWIKTLFTDPTAALGELWTGLVGEGGMLDILFTPLRLAIDWITKKLGWREEDAPTFSFGALIEEAIDGVLTMFRNAFNALPSWEQITAGIIASLPSWMVPEGLKTPEMRIQEREQAVAEEQERISRSEAGENVYFGRESVGRAESQAEIERLNAEIEALRSETIIPPQVAPSPTSQTGAALRTSEVVEGVRERNGTQVIQVPVERPAVDRAPSGNGGGGGAYLLPASPTIDILDAVPSYDARMYQGL